MVLDEDLVQAVFRMARHQLLTLAGHFARIDEDGEFIGRVANLFYRVTLTKMEDEGRLDAGEVKYRMSVKDEDGDIL
jgi:hypothetical protein